MSGPICLKNLWLLATRNYIAVGPSCICVLTDYMINQPGSVALPDSSTSEKQKKKKPITVAGESKLHIAMFPWLAFGHMIPFLEFAKLVAEKGHKISFSSTPKNIDRLPKLPPHLASLIHFIKLPLPQINHLPQNAEATIDVPLDDVWYFKKAYDGLQQPMAQLLQSLSPDWLLLDFAAYWLPSIARSLNIPNAFFSIVTAACLGYLGPPSFLMHGDEDHKKPEDYAVLPKWVTFPSTVRLKLYEVLKIYNGITGDKTNTSDFYRFGATLKDCDMVAVRSCMELEPEWLKLLEQLYEKPVIPVGELPTTDYNNSEETEGWKSMKEWLDKQEKGSVVYIAFGSEAKPSQEELNEIAQGLEFSGLPFLWVLRKSRGSTDAEPIKLPEGFEERTKERGVVLTTWAPQLKILAHDSIGGFLTHTGWSSVVEALQFQRPLILFTFLADQGINARLLEEKKIGYSIPRKEQDGSFTRNSVAESLRLVVVEDEGKIYRDKAKEMKRVFGDRDKQNWYLDNFLGYLENHRRLKNPEVDGIDQN
ncbi:PREDICTED: UDP-glycosyltransferase 91A1 [Theobroma cacao]|uniref:UDP-glycosyltransferase 91A1 n=1 Tax=Theobroma cacao TaxID=3641 RepID=A0AB32VXI9_THECC|nr:PREDICTED: UDP-glycosyltransferase 91A1 [Theobroma cacao]